MTSGSSDIVKFDLQTLEPVLNSGNIHPSDIIDEIPFPYSPSESDPMNSRNDSDSLDNNDYYKLSTDSEDDDLPTYPINDLEMTVVEGTETNELLIDIDDVANYHEIIDSGPSY